MKKRNEKKKIWKNKYFKNVSRKDFFFKTERESRKVMIYVAKRKGEAVGSFLKVAPFYSIKLLKDAKVDA